MNERVARLRQETLETKPWVSMERAALLTEFYRNDKTTSVAIRRARALQYVMEHKEIYIGPDDLIVGERGPAPKGTPTFPELCCHSMEDLDVLNSREKISYAVDEQARQIHKNEVRPYWRGRSVRDLIFAEMSAEWKAAYEAGIFTEFMEQRAPGHTVLGDVIYRKGLLDLKLDIEQALSRLDYFSDPEACAKRDELRAMGIAADAVIRFAERHAEKAEELALSETNPARQSELQKMAEVCRHVPAHAPRNFWEALQAYWFTHLGVVTELNTWDSFCPGRFDQHLYPFYRKDMEEGTLTQEQAKELLECLWVKFNNQPAPPKVGVTAAESGTYTDFANINNGGLKRDGSDGVNDVTYLILDVIDEMHLLQPSSNLQLSKKNPETFLRRGLEIVQQGWGQPSIFNADAVVEELLRQGKSLEDARCGGTSGCVETGAFGTEAYILTGYFNLPKVLEIALNNGVDPLTRKRIGIETGEARDFSSYEHLFDAFRKQLHHFIDVKVRGNNIIERMYADYMPAPFLSILVDDCIAKGKDYNDGGPRYNTNYIMGVAPATCTDSLAAIKYHVFDRQALTMDQLLDAVARNFEGHEKTRQLLWNKTPKFGNDDDYADAILQDVFDAFFDEVNGRPNTKSGCYRVNYLSTTCHVYFGSMTGATPDGRKERTPLSDGISPVQGADRHGPTAVIKSAAKMDHLRTGGTLLNQKFTPHLAKGEGLNKIAHLVRSYFRLDGHHIQFNVVTAATLRAAQAEPEKYRDLIVRVAGYSDYFCDLTRALQDEIIARTEHESFAAAIPELTEV
ncbi:formate C-acetyltransferase [Candidatus Sulfotelmatobacter kueseliae]|uniref:Formate C-acetyltransferase n=1 Tax=Candidatus Sulfotelmatobacter kueseliae TaxID=2042962 RepID=A0A2U3KWY9_9BACT|nr:formate C-acetyltransferase [Candidatus Sulfotelmatobacter kueseliae]